jgi:signal transduction histidine kinase
VELLGQPNTDEERRKRARALILTETERVARLAQELADTGHVATGRFNIKPAMTDLSEITRVQVDMARARTHRHAIRIEAPARLPIVCDPDRIAQVISNLLTNAIKYAEGGEIRVGLRREGEQVLLTVSDQGPGIPAARAESIFEAGSRLHQDTDGEAPEGSGFGLYIVKGIVEAHGGRIDVESGSERGATLCVVLPRVPTAAKTSADSASAR